VQRVSVRHDLRRLESIFENIHADTRARNIGFVGMSSEVRWLQDVADRRINSSTDDYPSVVQDSPIPAKEPLSSFCYWTDVEDGNTVETVDPHILPAHEIAIELLRRYIVDVHYSFPIISSSNFERQLCNYYTAVRQGNPPRLSEKWQAILNLLFAIGCIKKLGTNKAFGLDQYSHHVFHMRARSLHLDTAHAKGPPDIPSVQGYGLLAFYYLSIGKINQ